MEFGRQEEDKRVGIHRAVTQCQVSVLTDKRAKYQDNILTSFSPSSNFQKIDPSKLEPLNYFFGKLEQFL